MSDSKFPGRLQALARRRGRIIRGDAGPDSDIDLLIDIDPKVRFSLVDLVALKLFLEDRLGHKVDVVTRNGLDPRLKERVLGEAEAVFS